MRIRLVSFAALALVAIAVPPTADSHADYCYYPIPGPDAAPVPTPFPVPGPWPNGFGPGHCPTPPTYDSFKSTAPPCPPPPFIGAFFGQFCGPLVAPGYMAVCSAVPGVGAPALKGLVAGYDTTLDGNIDMADAYGGTPGLAYDFVPGPTGSDFTVVPYPPPTPARLIAYPIATGVGAVDVGCL